MTEENTPDSEDKKDTISSSAKKAAPKKKTAAKKKAAPKKKTAPKKAKASSDASKQSQPETIIDIEAKTIDPDDINPDDTEKSNGTSEEETSDQQQTSDDNAGPRKDWQEYVPERDWGHHVYGLAMIIIFGFIGTFAAQAFIFLMVINWVYELIKENENSILNKWIRLVGEYLRQIIDYFTGKDKDLPFPLGRDFPSE